MAKSSETWYQKAEREAGEEMKTLLSRPLAPTQDMIGVIDTNTNEPKYFDPWDIFPVYGSYSSEFDDMAIKVLKNLLDGNRKEETLVHEMFREILCKKNLCDYGTSPRVCFPTTEFRGLLPELITKWSKYRDLMWSPELLKNNGGEE